MFCIITLNIDWSWFYPCDWNIPELILPELSSFSEFIVSPLEVRPKSLDDTSVSTVTMMFFLTIL